LSLKTIRLLHFANAESFTVILVDTSLKTNTAGRLQKIKKNVEDETFMLTYGDGVSDCFHYIHQNPFVAALVNRMED